MKACLICDDHALVREALTGTVKLGWPEARITTTNDFIAAWAAAPGHDICIADLMMPGAEPLAGISGLKRAAPEMAILVVTGTHDDALLLDLLSLGVAGFAPKTTSSTLIEAALRVIEAGGRYLPPRVADIAAAQSSRRGRDGAAATPARPGEHVLTDRQIDVLRLAANGRSNKEIAVVLGVSPETIKSHLSIIHGILGAANRTDAAARARHLKLI